MICVPEINILFAFSLFWHPNGTIALWLSNCYTTIHGIRSSSVESLRLKILVFFFFKEPKSTVFTLLYCIPKFLFSCSVCPYSLLSMIKLAYNLKSNSEISHVYWSFGSRGQLTLSIISFP